MIMEHMHLLERRQDRSFILIAQWQLIIDPQTNLKCRVFGAGQGFTDRGWQPFSKGKIPSNLLSCTFARLAKNRALCINVTKLAKKVVSEHICKFTIFVQIWTKGNCPSCDFGRKEAVFRLTLDKQMYFFHNVYPSRFLTMSEFNCSQKISNSWTQKGAKKYYSHT